MAFTVNPAEAQAMQEDVAQLMSAIAQVARSLSASFKFPQPIQPARSPQTEKPETIQIRMGRRLVYGQMADGQFRNDLYPDRLKLLFEALQRPVTQGVDLDKYKGKMPAIEIRDGDQILFREERDGTVTVNQIEFKLQQQKESASSWQTRSQPDLNQQQQQVQQIQELRVLSLAVLDLQGTTDSEQLRQYQADDFLITESLGDRTLTITASDGSTVLQTSKDGQILQADLAIIPIALQQIDVAYRQAEEQQWLRESGELPPSDLTPNEQSQSVQAQDIARTARTLLNPFGETEPIYDFVSVQGYRIAQNEDGLIVTRSDADDLVLIERDGQVWDYGATRQDWENFQRFQAQNPMSGVEGMRQSIHDRVDLTADVTPLEAEGENQLPAIAIAQQEAARLPNSHTKDLLQATHQTWKRQSDRRVGLRLQEENNWLSIRPESKRNQKTARAALQLFQRGYSRTEEQGYEMGSYAIHHQGKNVYSLSDARGELLRFQTRSSLIPGWNRPVIQILSHSKRLSSYHQQDLRMMQRDKSLMPLGALDVEANYGAKTQQVERTVRSFLLKMQAQSWDKEGGRYRFETGHNMISIVDKQDGRGEVYRRENGKVFSNLGGSDFAHFDRLAERLQTQRQQITQPSQQPSPVRSKKNSPGLELS
jgi:hypothetical protein